MGDEQQRRLMLEDIERLKKINRELLDALESALTWIRAGEEGEDPNTSWEACNPHIRAIIKKAKGS